MKITRIDIKGEEGYATIKRRPLNIEVDLHSPNGSQSHVVEDLENDDDLYAMASCIQRQLDGYVGTNSDIHDYYRTLQRLVQG